jgi:hypothetical protein
VVHDFTVGLGWIIRYRPVGRIVAHGGISWYVYPGAIFGFWDLSKIQDTYVKGFLKAFWTGIAE